MNSYGKEPCFPGEGNFFFEVSTIEWLNDTRLASDQPTRYPHHQIVWITKGTGTFCIDMEKYRIADNSVYMIPPGRMRQFEGEANISGYILSFNTDFLYLATAGPGRPFFEEMVTDFNKVNMLSLSSDCEGLQNLLREISRECDKELIHRMEILSGLMKVFLVTLKRSSKAVRQQFASSRKMRLFINFSSKLEKNFLTKRLVAEYASELSVTPNYLTEVVKKITGYSASYHIQQRMVQEAKRLAMYSDANMKVIAYTLGFDDLSHFSKFFKNAAGMNFTEFKKKAPAQTRRG
jgi:AraC family transcriptional activator of pobA